MKRTNATAQMQTQNTEKTSMRVRRDGAWAVRAVALVVAMTAAFAGCAEGGGGDEGDRCNPDLSHSECNGSLTCQVVSDPVSGASCGESYCCPTPATDSTNGYCNGKLEAPQADGTPVCPLPQGSSSTASSSGATSAASS
ncbi:MAG: hypothetical protein FWD17_04840, partial [Polyangiaceae bacterium]|nr:hypothetical protein [Polyangiaceae bacterium]